MTATSVAGAPSACLPDWNSIDWTKIHKQVYRLQVRIAKAVREKHWGKVAALQHLLTHSQAAKFWAVRRVVTNKGRIRRASTGNSGERPGAGSTQSAYFDSGVIDRNHYGGLMSLNPTAKCDRWASRP